MLNMTKLLKQLKTREWLYALTALIFIIAQVWMDLKMPDYMNLITQIAQGGINAETGLAYELSDIWKNGGCMLLCALEVWHVPLSPVSLWYRLQPTFPQGFGSCFTEKCRASLWRRLTDLIPPP